MNPTELTASGVATHASGIVLEMVGAGQSWTRAYIGGQAVQASGIGPGQETQNSQNVFSPEERANNRAEIEEKRLRYIEDGNELLQGYPCGEGPDIALNKNIGGTGIVVPLPDSPGSGQTGWSPHVADGWAGQISGGPYGNGDFALGDSDYPCPDARYYAHDTESSFNTDGIRLRSLPPDQRGEPLMIPAYQFYVELMSKTSDWKDGVANPKDSRKELARGIVKGSARRRELKDKLKISGTGIAVPLPDSPPVSG